MREPEDREQLIELLHSSYERNLLDSDALSMIEGVLQVSELQARDIMIPRAQMGVIDIVEAPDKFIPFVTFFMDPKTNEKVHWLEMLKWAATVQGAPAGIPRRPLRELSEEAKQAMKKPLDILLS